jgi:hypothetical protein
MIDDEDIEDEDTDDTCPSCGGDGGSEADCWSYRSDAHYTRWVPCAECAGDADPEGDPEDRLARRRGRYDD